MRSPIRPTAGAAVLLLAAGRAGAQAVAPKPALLVLAKADRTLAVVDPATGAVAARVPAGPDPHEVVVSPDGRLAHVSNDERDPPELDLPAFYEVHSMTKALTEAMTTAAPAERRVPRARRALVASLGALFACAALAGAPAAGAQTAVPNDTSAARAGGDAYLAIAHLRAKPERLDDFVAAVRALRARTVAEPGVVRYELLQDPADRTRFTVVELYRDKAAFDAHVAAPYVRAFFGEVPRYLAERGTGEFFAARRDGVLPVDPR